MWPLLEDAPALRRSAFLPNCLVGNPLLYGK
jgi:hypothetical protein